MISKLKGKKWSGKRDANWILIIWVTYIWMIFSVQVRRLINNNAKQKKFIERVFHRHLGWGSSSPSFTLIFIFRLNISFDPISLVLLHVSSYLMVYLLTAKIWRRRFHAQSTAPVMFLDTGKADTIVAALWFPCSCCNCTRLGRTSVAERFQVYNKGLLTDRVVCTVNYQTEVFRSDI